MKIQFDGKKLSEIMTRKKINATTVAHLLRFHGITKCSRMSVHQWMKEVSNPTLSAMVTICKIFEVDMEYFVKNQKGE